MAGRRAALLALPGLAAAPAAASADTDAELLAFLPRIRAARARSHAAVLAEDAVPLGDADALMAQRAKSVPVFEAEDALLEDFAAIPAESLLGVAVKAGVLAAFGDGGSVWESDLTDGLLADVRRLVPAIAPALSSPRDGAVTGGV